MDPNRQKQIDAKEFQLKGIKDGLRRCDENIKIFSEKVEEQRGLKVELEVDKAKLETEINTLKSVV